MTIHSPEKPAAPSPPRRSLPRLIGSIIGALAVAIALGATYAAIAGWIPGAGNRPISFNGGLLETPMTIPALHLQRADGGTFETADLLGRYSLVFFGYTHCPDVCPLTLAHAAQVARSLGDDAAMLDVYLVTVDPERDTAERMETYMANFGPRAVGLLGTADALDASYQAFGASHAKRPDPNRPGEYTVDHSAILYLVEPTGAVRLIYPFNMEPELITADLKTLLAAQPIRLRDAWARPAPAGQTSGAYLTIQNVGRDDRLLGASAPVSDRVEVHRTSVEGGMASMHRMDALAIPKGLTKLEPGGLHVMLMNLREPLASGTRVPLTLRFEKAGEQRTAAIVRAAN
ncbi:MAG: copper chaperone PCu(A)C [Chloroflexota bacterium]|nr:MAG: copper chaperone PCu(A)C [Chloroflexota bacterium]